jgi:FHA domain-containing protein
MLCPACGYENPGTVRQCAHCGSWLSTPHHAGHPAAYPPGVPESRIATANTLAFFISPRIANAPTTPAFTPPRALLRVMIGYCSQREVDCSHGTVTIGRAPDNSLIVDDGRVSRQHARIELEDGRWRITDAGSHNGTFVNGARIHTHPLHSGDKIVVGSTLLEFHLH